MSNPYDDIFGNDPAKKPLHTEKKEDPIPMPSEEDLSEPLDELVAACASFAQKATQFAQLLTNTRAADHEVPLAARQPILRLLVRVEDQTEKGNLAAERKYHQSVTEKFQAIITPMRALAKQHLAIVKQYFNAIDEHYYSVHKTDLEVKREIESVQKNILVQRQILHDAQSALTTLSQALSHTETRLKNYINRGGTDNLSAAEHAILQQQREQLTEGLSHAFNYEFFKLNLLDKTALSFGKITQQTSSQYIQKLSLALEANEK